MCAVCHTTAPPTFTTGAANRIAPARPRAAPRRRAASERGARDARRPPSPAGARARTASVQYGARRRATGGSPVAASRRRRVARRAPRDLPAASAVEQDVAGEVHGTEERTQHGGNVPPGAVEPDDARVQQHDPAAPALQLAAVCANDVPRPG